MSACLRNRCHYLGLSNEANTFIDAWSLEAAAGKAGATIVPGAGLGTVAAECLAAHVVERIDEPFTLSIVRTSSHEARTPGAKVTMFELLVRPGAGVKDGRLECTRLQDSHFRPAGRTKHCCARRHR